MKPMADALFQVMFDKYGSHECLQRLGDPLWFQALSNVLGFDWDSSGTTTVLCGVLRSVLSSTRHGLVAVGGKGIRSRQIPKELHDLSKTMDLGEQSCKDLIYASRMAAKVDNAALQDGFHLYHQMFFLESEKCAWTIVQQGMDEDSKTSRRYHWVSEHLTTFIEEPHSGLISARRNNQVLDLTARKSRACRTTCTQIAREESPQRIRRQFLSLKSPCDYQKTTLTRWFSTAPHSLLPDSMILYHRVIPDRMDWEAVKKVYDLQPSTFEELLAIRGMGPATIRGLALLSEMVHGTAPSWQDPVRMTFAFGGKDGVPFPVDRKSYDDAITFLEDAIDKAHLGQREKLQAFQRLRTFLENPSIHCISS
jgi:hypothetical protein